MAPVSRASRRLCTLVVLAVALWLSPNRLQAGPPPEAPERSGAELYRAACATCHGSDGRGTAAVQASYPVAPPDFTDCNFATREPDLDWIAVSHGGGPARGFDPLMPSFAELLSVEELARVVAYVRRFCVEEGWPRGELNLPRALVTSKAFPEDEAALRVIADETRVTTRFVYATRVGRLSQFEVVVPVSVAKGDDGAWRGGAGDFAFAFKHVLAHDLEWGGIVSAAAELVVPTGSTERGFGAGTAVLEPFLAYGLLLSSRSFVQFQVGGGIPYDREHSDELFARAVLGGRLIESSGFGRAWTPMLEILGARELATDALTHVDAVPQLQVTLSARQHVVANAGLRIPMNDRSERPAQVMAYVIWDWFDGGFFDGW